MKPSEKVHTTNYYNTFIEVAEDTKVRCANIPLEKNGNKTIASMQFELISKNPYTYTSDDVFFKVYADRNDLIKSEYTAEREQFFSKGQPCFRASPLPKQFGFGLHFDAEGKIALCGMESEEYQNFIKDETIKKVKAMRSSKK